MQGRKEETSQAILPGTKVFKHITDFNLSEALQLYATTFLCCWIFNHVTKDFPQTHFSQEGPFVKTHTLVYFTKTPVK